jgi:predicted HAD superfamily Cof-like phosphohydrolase
MKDILTNATALVRDFHTTFGHPVATVPTLIDIDRLDKRAEWIVSEVDELMDPTKQTIEDQIDATMDIIYFALGNLVELGVDPTPFFQIVQDANMAKVWPDGTVHKNNGKTIKPPGWEAPEPKLLAEVQRQIAAGIARQDHLEATEGHDAFFKRGAHAIPAVQATSQTEKLISPMPTWDFAGHAGGFISGEPGLFGAGMAGESLVPLSIISNHPKIETYTRSENGGPPETVTLNLSVDTGKAIMSSPENLTDNPLIGDTVLSTPEADIEVEFVSSAELEGKADQ